METNIELNHETLRDWMSDTWMLYASQMFNGKLLRMYINLNGIYRVTHGETIIYQDNQLIDAIAAWNSVK